VWSLLLLAAIVWSFAHLPLGLSNRNKMVLWPGCEGRVRCSCQGKNVRSVWFVVKRKGCCCILSVGFTLNVRFTMNRMCVKNNTHTYVVQTTNNRGSTPCDLYCCLQPQCEALRTCCLCFSITTLASGPLLWQVGLFPIHGFSPWLKSQVMPLDTTENLIAQKSNHCFIVWKSNHCCLSTVTFKKIEYFCSIIT